MKGIMENKNEEKYRRIQSMFKNGGYSTEAETQNLGGHSISSHLFFIWHLGLQGDQVCQS